MDETFIAVLKLTTNEEVIGTITLTEKHGLLIKEPMLIQEITDPSIPPEQMRTRGFSLCRWIKSSTDDTFFISMDRVITIGELKEPVLSVYKRSLESSNYVSSQKPEKKKYSGYRCLVDDARKKFEDLFKRY